MPKEYQPRPSQPLSDAREIMKTHNNNILMTPLCLMMSHRVCLIPILLPILLTLTSCMRPDQRTHVATLLTEDEESLIHAVLSQLPHESAIKPYVTVSDLTLPPVMFDPSYDVFSQDLRRNTKNKGPSIGGAAEDFLKKNRPTTSAPVGTVAHADISWATVSELKSLLSTEASKGGMKWLRLKEKLGDVPRFFRVSRPGIDQSKETGIIYVGVHYPAGPSSGRLYVLRKRSNSWIIDAKQHVGPEWAF